ncbi:hypothetical protein J4416_01120 [Candidatus Pacearchaeota archaeon]|nr:hypothetical protein [Candidatus Pacearchaeota archaeon]
MAKPFRGKGLGTAAHKLLIKYAFKNKIARKCSNIQQDFCKDA